MSAAPAPVAQLDRASDYESEGRTFESFRARQIPPITAETTPAHTAVFRGGKVRIGSGRLVNFDPAQTWDLGLCRGRTAMGWERTVWFWFWNQKRSEEHTSELQSLMRISYADLCLKKKKIIE